MTATIAFIALAYVLASQQCLADDFPIAKLQYKGGSRLVLLHSCYGFVAKWEPDGKPRFFLYDKPQMNISVTRDLQTFLEGLSMLPDRSEVAWANTCGAPLHYGMPAEMLSRIDHVLRAKKFRMAGIGENNFVLCTCEATNLSFFTSLSQRLQRSGAGERER